MHTRIVVSMLLSVSLAAAAHGALSKEHNDFAKGPTQYLLTRDEQKQWKAIATDAQAQAFIDLFWARRDPTPGTAPNEFRDLIDKRIAVADSLFTTAKLRGSATDRGKVYVLMGPQTTIKRGGPQGGSGVHAPSSSIGSSTGLDNQSVQGVAPSEMWQYELSKTTLPLGQPLFQVAFNDQYASNDWKMERITGNDYATVFDRVARAYLVQPNLEALPVFATATATPVATAGAAPPSLRTEALRTAIDVARASKSTSDALFVNYGTFATPAGEAFVPVQIYVPQSAGLSAPAAVTFFGAVDGADGRVVEIEEPVTLVPSKNDLYYARSFKLAPGSYTGTFGIARDGKVISIVSTPMTIAANAASEPELSELMLSNNVYALTTAQQATDPFTFGGIRIVPKGDRVFRTTDDLWFFVETRNPGTDAAANAPKMTLQFSVQGKADDGTVVDRSAPAELANVQPLKGVPGHYVIAESIPLSAFKPGSYTITVRVKDAALDRSYDRAESFRVIR